MSNLKISFNSRRERRDYIIQKAKQELKKELKREILKEVRKEEREEN